MPASDLAGLVTQFTRYKNTGMAPSHFGRDAPYSWPDAVQKADMHHLHLGQWSLRVLQYRRTSNTHVVYCRGFKSKGNYLLIAVIDYAHERADKTTFMLELAEIAERFREKF